jgi:hypothetical protein
MEWMRISAGVGHAHIAFQPDGIYLCCHRWSLARESDQKRKEKPEMKPIRTVMTTLLVTGLATLGYAKPPLGVAAPAFSALASGSAAQQDDQKPKDTPDSKPADAAKPDKDQDKSQDKDARPQAPDKSQTPDAEKPAKPPKQPAPDKAQTQDDKNPKPDQNVARQDQKQDQKQDNARPASGGRIPDKDFKAHFGQAHKFSARQVVTTTTIVPNQTRFVYTGYTFVFADPWPAGWSVDDDCYIDYIDGEYYFLDLAHPGVQIELTIVG